MFEGSPALFSSVRQRWGLRGWASSFSNPSAALADRSHAAARCHAATARAPSAQPRSAKRGGTSCCCPPGVCVCVGVRVCVCVLKQLFICS